MKKSPALKPTFGLDVPYLLAAWREMLSPRTLPGDLMAGVVVAVIALPLCIALAIASGAPPAVGLVTGVVGGLVAALLGGSRFSVTGPAAAMAVLLADIAEDFGPGGVLTAGLLCGVLQVATGLLRLGRFVRYLPVPVISGFTSGIGVLIVLMQMPNLLGLPKPAGGLSQLASLGGYLAGVNWADAAVALVTVLAMVAVPRKGKVPGALVAVVAGTAASLLLPAVLPAASVSRVGPIPRMLPAPGLWAVPWDRLGELLAAALAVYALGTVESLLCAVSCDSQSGTGHRSDQELIGQGVANLVVPFFGGLPVTGVIVRSSAGIKAGARTRMAAVCHAAVLLLLMVAFANLAALIPRAALAGILLVTGCRMFEWQALVRTLRTSRAEGVVLAGTLLATVVTDLLAGVVVGMGLAVATFAWKVTRQFSTRSQKVEGDHPKHRVAIHHVEGPLFFGAAPQFTASLEELHGQDVLILNLEGARNLDTTACEAITHLAGVLRRRGTVLLLSGLGPNRGVLKRFGTLDAVGPGNVFLRLSTAVARAKELAHRTGAREHPAA